MDVAQHPVRLDKRLIQDPEPVYRDLQAGGPVQPVVMPNGVRGWLVTSYAQARALLDDRRLSKDVTRARDLFPAGTAGAHASPLAAHMLNSDPPDHTRLRRLVSKAFTTRAVTRLRPRIEQITDDLLTAMPAQGQVDLVDSFAFPLPITVISELLGVPDGDRDRMRTWSRAIVSGAPQEAWQRASGEVTGYLRALVAAKRAVPTEDLLSDLVHVCDQGDRLTGDELVSMAFLLLLAGHETTVNLIANSVLALLRNPGQMALLRSDPGLVPDAVEEFLRSESPVHIATVRFTTEPVPAGETTIPAGEFVMISLLAANHDGDRFPAPAQLDLTRAAGGHVAFGHGIHYCIGAPLARLEAEIALQRLLSRFATLTLAGEPGQLKWRSSTLIHGLRSLPVHIATS